MSDLQQIAQALGLASDTSLEQILETCKIMRKRFVEQVLIASRIPQPSEIEGQGPKIT